MELDAVLGFRLKEMVDTTTGSEEEAGSESSDEEKGEIEELLEARERARKQKNFKEADNIRDRIDACGWVIEDTPQGPRLKRK